MCIRIGTEVGTHPSFSTIVFIGTILRNWESSLGRRVGTSSARLCPKPLRLCIHLLGYDDYGAISINRVLVSKPKSSAQVGCVAKPPFYPLNYGDAWL